MKRGRNDTTRTPHHRNAPGVDPNDGTIIDAEAYDTAAAERGNRGDYFTEQETPHPAEVSQFDDEYSEGANLHDSDVRLPILELIQAQTLEKGGGKPAQFLRKDTGDLYDVMKVIPLAVQKTRTKWQPIFKRGEGPTCYSANALSTTITVRDHIEKGCVSCAKRYDGATDDILDTLKRCDRTCPHFTASPWDDKRADDYCSPGYASLLYDVTETDGEVLVEDEDGNEYGGEVVMLRTSGVNSKHTPDFVGLTNRIGRGGKMVARPKNLRQRVFNMSAEEKPTDSGTAAELILIPGAQTDLDFVKALWAEGKERYNLALRQEPETEGQNALGAGGFVGSGSEGSRTSLHPERARRSASSPEH